MNTRISRGFLRPSNSILEALLDFYDLERFTARVDRWLSLAQQIDLFAARSILANKAFSLRSILFRKG